MFQNRPSNAKHAHNHTNPGLSLGLTRQESRAPWAATEKHFKRQPQNQITTTMNTTVFVILLQPHTKTAAQYMKPKIRKMSSYIRKPETTLGFCVLLNKSKKRNDTPFAAANVPATLLLLLLLLLLYWIFFYFFTLVIFVIGDGGKLIGMALRWGAGRSWWDGGNSWTHAQGFQNLSCPFRTLRLRLQAG